MTYRGVIAAALLFASPAHAQDALITYKAGIEAVTDKAGVLR